jgi:apolipoprotein D and lipocalin family protein
MNIGLLSDIFSRGARDIPAVCDVDLPRYMGAWYEIARLHNTFEEGLDYVTAVYQLRSDGKVDVTNTGIKGGKNKSAQAVAWVPDQRCPGKLLVSFFRPMRSQYNIIRLDEDYRYAVVAGSRMNYLWILSREPRMDDDLYDELVHFVSGVGFDGNRLIKIKQAD